VNPSLLLFLIVAVQMILTFFASAYITRALNAPFFGLGRRVLLVVGRHNEAPTCRARPRIETDLQLRVQLRHPGCSYAHLRVQLRQVPADRRLYVSVNTVLSHAP
jgi:hypothetical protein